MNKKQHDQERIELLKERFQNLSTEKILLRLTDFNTTNEFVIAYKQILKDRDINDYYDEIANKQK